MAKINYDLFVAGDENYDITVTQAHEMIVAMMAFEMPYDSVVAQQGSNPTGAVQELTINNIIAAKLPADQKFYFIGRYNDDPDQKAYILGEDRQFFFIPQADGTPAKQKDGETSFIAIWCDRHQGHTQADAVQAATQLGAVKIAVAHEFASIRALVNA